MSTPTIGPPAAVAAIADRAPATMEPTKKKMSKLPQDSDPSNRAVEETTTKNATAKEVVGAAASSTTTPTNSRTVAGSAILELEGSLSTKSPVSATKTTPSTSSSASRAISAPGSAASSTSKKKSPTYLKMVTDVIRHLNSKSGSSLPAIHKCLCERYNKPADAPHVRKAIGNAVKDGVKEERFAKVRNSFKINAKFKQKERDVKRREERRRAALKKKQVAEEARKKQEKVEKEARQKREKAERESLAKERMANVAALQQKEREREAERREAERQRSLELARRQREEAERKRKAEEARALAERVRKRRFPMDDRALIAEDAELGVAPPPAVLPRPPVAPWRLDGPAASDALCVYHVLRGDLGLLTDDVPAFSPDHLARCVVEVDRGAARRARAVPPLLTALFARVLRRLGTTAPRSSARRAAATASAADWGEAAARYADVVHAASSRTDGDEEEWDGWLGPPGGTLRRARERLGVVDPWRLTGEELLRLLRCLCDDLVDGEEVAEKVDRRLEEVQETVAVKRRAEIEYRKAKLAYEGPKHKRRKKKAPENGGNGGNTSNNTTATTTNSNTTITNNNNTNNNTDVSSQENNDNDTASQDNTTPNDDETTSQEKKTSATAARAAVDEDPVDDELKETRKKELLAAEKRLRKCVDAHDRALRRSVGRTEPVGRDRDFVGAYHFADDPSRVWLRRESGWTADPDDDGSRWSVLATRSASKRYAASLDARGVRERALLAALQRVRPRLENDETDTAEDRRRRARRGADLRKRTESARANARTGRSGRLAELARAELEAAERELREFERTDHERREEAEAEVEEDARAACGLDAVRAFEEEHDDVERYSDAWKRTRRDVGAVTRVVDALSRLEEKCHEMSPRLSDAKRRAWRERLSDTVKEWRRVSPLRLSDETEDGDENDAPPKNGDDEDEDEETKPILEVLKDSLLHLESRVCDMTGRAIRHEDERRAREDAPANEDEAWRIKVRSLRHVAPNSTLHVRDVLVAAIADARAVRHDAADDLVAALRLHRQNTAADAKRAALDALTKHGDPEPTEEETERGRLDPIRDDDDDQDDRRGDDDDDDGEDDDLLTDETRCLFGHLPNADNDHRVVDRDVWTNNVRACATFSRLAALCLSFVDDALAELDARETARAALIDAVEVWRRREEAAATATGRRGRRTPAADALPSETDVWVDHVVTNEFCAAKVCDGYPWWPARVCEVREADIADALRGLRRVVVAFVGERQLYVVREEDQVRPYSDPEAVVRAEGDDLDDYGEGVVAKWRQSLRLASRLVPQVPVRKTFRPRRKSSSYGEEKKSTDS